MSAYRFGTHGEEAPAANRNRAAVRAPSCGRRNGEMMAGAGFEPGKAEPRDLQSRPFDRSGIPPGGPSLVAATRSGRKRPGRLDLEFGVLRTPKQQPGPAFDRPGRDVPASPISNVDENDVAARLVESFDEPAPALVATARRKHHAENSPASPCRLGVQARCMDQTYVLVRTENCWKTSPTKRLADVAPRAAPRASSACGSRSGGSARG